MCRPKRSIYIFPPFKLALNKSLSITIVCVTSLIVKATVIFPHLMCSDPRQNCRPQSWLTRPGQTEVCSTTSQMEQKNRENVLSQAGLA